ncbi:DUF3095 family protein [Candidatus Nomurabacteria bacterium]|nr:DUF3095 family protein [Candidatus Nomurabacteria bacterium]
MEKDIIQLEHFYTDLPPHRIPFKEVIESHENFTEVPDGWSVVVTDVENSTKNIDNNKYQEVNILAVSSLILAINIAKKHDVAFPFIYGGDGATVLMPDAYIDEYTTTLATLRTNGINRFGLTIRVGVVSMKEIHSRGGSVRIAKYYVNEGYDQAVFLGDGLYMAETLIKKEGQTYRMEKEDTQVPIDLSGLECRWNAIRPPSEKDEVVCLIIHAVDFKKHNEVYRTVLEKIDEFYGNFEERHPIRREHLSATLGFKTLKHASYVKYGKIKWSYIVTQVSLGIIRNISTLFHRILYSFHHETYTSNLITASDTLKIDGTLKTIVAGTEYSRMKLIAYLEEAEKRGDLVYGYHETHASVMTCYVMKDVGEHVNFLDGFGGGYTQAGKMIKEKLRRITA